ncbi:MAG TPA: prephenate dehydrogenase/arogenate dehydrogenase family protein [Elusimicrobiota bacterium]|nr:prephenate dehydrogenase/arogenate dehydrogenase family protein [Elusimicrobiota bacterium]
MTAGLIGFGRIGRLLVRHFARDAKIRVYDHKLDARAVRALGAVPATLAEACAQEVVVLCVPIGAFEALTRRIKGLVRPGALVVDVCSVKEHPVRAMKRHLPKSVSLLATHPNFGPDSAADSLKGRKIVLCKVRMKDADYGGAKRALERKGLDVIEMTPREHDRRMASSLVLTHFIGRSLIAYGAKTTGVDTEGYKRLLRILETVQNDSWELFQDMNRFNAYAAPMRRRFLAAMRATDRRVAR